MAEPGCSTLLLGGHAMSSPTPVSPPHVHIHSSLPRSARPASQVIAREFDTARSRRQDLPAAQLWSDGGLCRIASAAVTRARAACGHRLRDLHPASRRGGVVARFHHIGLSATPHHRVEPKPGRRQAALRHGCDAPPRRATCCRSTGPPGNGAAPRGRRLAPPPRGSAVLLRIIWRRMGATYAVPSSRQTLTPRETLSHVWASRADARSGREVGAECPGGRTSL